SCPPFITSKVGILRTAKRAAVAGLSSMFTFAIRRRFPISVANSSNTGAIMRQGPHQGAHISTKTGTGDRSTSAANVLSVTVTGPEALDKESGALQRPQTGSCPPATFCALIRFVAPHFAQ